MVINTTSLSTYANEENNYKDIDHHWAKAEILRLVSEEVVNGRQKGNALIIDPEASVTRGEFIKMVMSSIVDMTTFTPENTSEDTDNMLNDIEGHWAKAYIVAAVEKGIVNGYSDGSFKPDAQITRSEAVKIIVSADNHLAMVVEEGTAPYNDVSDDYWAAPFITVANDQGLVKGYEGKIFKPMKDISRAEAMVIVDRFIDYYSLQAFIDNLKSIAIKPSEESVEAGQSVAFTLSNNELAAMLKGVKRTNGLNFNISLTTEDGQIASIEKGVDGFEFEIVKDTDGIIVAMKDGEPVGSALNGKVHINNLVSIQKDFMSTDIPEASQEDKNNDRRRNRKTVVVAESLTMSTTAAALQVGAFSDPTKNSINLDVTIMPTNTSDQSVTWHSANTAVAQVDGDGMVIGISAGMTVVEARSANGITTSAAIEVILMDEGTVGSSQVAIDMSGYNYDVSSGIYYIGEALKPITGKAKMPLSVKEIIYVVKDSQGKVLLSNTLQGSEDFILNPMGLGLGMNFLEVKATDGRSTTSSALQILNYYPDNTKNLDVDGSDEDKDSLMAYLEEAYGTNPSVMDTDGDGVTDGEEVIESKTNPTLKDTDGDGLMDGFELLILHTNPLEKDTDGNGVDDGQEDFDDDSLSNIEEVTLSGNPLSDDTDYDGLLDGEEKYYGTKLDVMDTDTDGLTDKEEIDQGTNPLLRDSDGNGIDDGDEIKAEIHTLPAGTNGLAPVLNIRAKAKLIKTLTMEPVKEDDFYLPSNMPGYLGTGFEFEMEGEFESATLTIAFDKKLLEDPTFEPAIYYCDEENQEMVLLKNQNIDIENGTVTVILEHFSKYILLNKTSFDDVWNQDIKPPTYSSGPAKNLSVVFVIDSSGSMGSNDRDNIRKTAAIQFVNKLGDEDQSAIVDFDSYAYVWSPLTKVKADVIAGINKVNSSGGTNIGRGVEAAINLFDPTENDVKYIILLTDGQGQYNHDLTKEAAALGITIYTIGLGRGVTASLLESIASGTKGKYYHATTANELPAIYEETAQETIDYQTDTDGDGLSDYYENEMLKGHLLKFNGTQVPTLMDNPDTDGDGLKDGEEASVKLSIGGVVQLNLSTSPVHKDTDKDGYNDGFDLNPTKPFVTPVIFLHGRTDNSDSCFGIDTRVNIGNNSHYGEDTPKYGLASYEEVFGQMITTLAYGKLGEKVVGSNDAYAINKNVFAFNYPNEDFAAQNSPKLKGYIENIIKWSKTTNSFGLEKDDLFPTQTHVDLNKYEFDLIGHSNGGLVSRYYIENLGGDEHVRKLITIDTPHYGSGLAKPTGVLPGIMTPLDYELRPASSLYGGEKTIFSTGINGHTLPSKIKYIQDYQSDALKGNSNVDTDYYAIGGYDVSGSSPARDLDPNDYFEYSSGSEMSAVPVNYFDTTFMFDFNINTSSKSAFNESIRQGMKDNAPTYFYLRLADSGGDNVVETLSQYGLKISGNSIVEKIDFLKTSLTVDTTPGHTFMPKSWISEGHFHGLNQNDPHTGNKVVDYLED